MDSESELVINLRNNPLSSLEDQVKIILTIRLFVSAKRVISNEVTVSEEYRSIF